MMKMKRRLIEKSLYSKKNLTFPFCVTKYPLLFMSCPFNVVTPPAIAFTACKRVLRIDFFKEAPSNCLVSYTRHRRQSAINEHQTRNDENETRNDYDFE